MSLSISEPELTPSTSSGLSPKALHGRHAARQRAEHEEQYADRKPPLKRLRRLSYLQHAREHTLPRPEESNGPSSSRDQACRPHTTDPGTSSAEPKMAAPLQASGAAPSIQQAPSAKAPPESANQKGAAAKHRQRADAPRHLADPLSSKPVVSRKRNVSEVLNLFKGKVSQALAQRKHLKPARLDVGPQLQDKAMHRQQGFQRDVVQRRTAAANDCVAHVRKPIEREHAQRSKAESPREQHHHPGNSQDMGLQMEVPYGPEEVAEVDQPARCKAPGNVRNEGAGQQGTAKGAAQTCASIAQCSPVKEGPPQECQPPAKMPAVPPEKYAHHLKSCLLQRFCQASGLSKEQARHPEALQQGIASLVSALNCNANKRSAGTSREASDKQHAGNEAVRRPAACSETFQHVSAPSILYPSRRKQQVYKPAPPVASKDRTLNDTLFHSSDPAGQREDKSLPQSMEVSAYPWGQRGSDRDAFLGIQSVSLRFAEDDPEAELLPDMAAPDTDPDDGLNGWMDSIHSPEPSLDKGHRKGGHYSMHSMPSAPDLLLTEGADMTGRSPDAHTLGLLPSSPQLANALQEHAGDRLQKSFIKAGDYLDAEQAYTNDVRASLEEDPFLHMLRRGAEAELEATGLPDLQDLSKHQEPNDKAYGLGGRDEAWLHDPADLQDNASDLISDFEALADKDVDDVYPRARSGKVHVRSNSRSRQHTWLEAEPDPVATFSSFCESLAV